MRQLALEYDVHIRNRTSRSYFKSKISLQALIIHLSRSENTENNARIIT